MEDGLCEDGGALHGKEGNVEFVGVVLGGHGCCGYETEMVGEKGKSGEGDLEEDGSD